ncbi:hypothetical protein BC938DRAFT_484064 [Jimgerdemannia flammicorona]|uniref:Pus10 N-terminal eukaryotes domain-containing protein n=1 Tax=Jimgerdemannia flammicorona TaxID=994334 RepID=A0A433QAM1_9FUNG|nr:hypothetical protein BC938DRAFT_484064 [Jimgerdemannia flammicorona]
MEDTNEPPKKKLKSTDSHPQQNLYAAANAEVKDGPVSTLNKMTDPANISSSTPYTEETLIQKMRWWLAIHHNSFAAPLAAVHALRQLPCCYHCCLRFVGIQQPWKIYTFTEKHLESFFTNLLEDPRVEKPYLTILRSTVPTNPLSVPCVVCLGTLQNAGSPDFVDPILSKSKAEKYRVLDFSFTLTLPPGALVRNHAVRLHLAEQLSLQNIPTGFDFDKVVDLKEPFRLLVAWRIAEGIRLKHNPYVSRQVWAVCTCR